MSIKIEDGVPLPKERFPFSELGVGQSFFAEDMSTRRFPHVSYARKKYPDRTFVVRTVEGGVRVWRTK